MRKVAVLLVAAIVLAVVAFHQSSKPVTVTCGTASGGQQMTAKGVQVAQDTGAWIRRIALTKVRDQVDKSVHGVEHIVVDLWLKSLIQSGRGKKIDPQILQLQQEAKDAQDAANAGCTPCTSTVTTPDVPAAPEPPAATAPWDPNSASLRTTGTLLTGAGLAEDAARKAGFPEAQIPMASAVARYESSYNPNASLTYHGAHMRGMWQINDMAHPDLLVYGNWRNPYINARMAYSVWTAAGNSWKPWSTATKAAASLGEPEPDIPDSQSATPAPGCTAIATTEGPAGLGGTITQTAELNAAGAGNWQGAVKLSNGWMVAGDEGGRIIFHRLNAAGVEVDQMSAPGAAHPTGFGVVGTTIYCTWGSDVVTFPYTPGTSISKSQTQKTGWQGFISMDPSKTSAVIRNGNHYRAYSLATHQPIGDQVTTTTGMRQGFSMNGDALYVMSGVTNEAARVDSYSFATGKQTGSQNITNVGYHGTEHSSHREPEGMDGNTFGVKVFTGADRRLRIFTLSPLASTTSTATISDDFNYTGKPDSTKWATYGGAGYKHHGTRSSANVSVSGGVLTITGTPSGVSGGISSKFDRGNTTSGRWETRMRVFGSTPTSYRAKGWHPVLIIWPDAGRRPSTDCQELDYSESNGNVGKVSTFVHTGCNGQQDSASKIIDQRQWHTYGVTWDANHVTTTVDGAVLYTTTNPAKTPNAPSHSTIQLDNFLGQLGTTHLQVDYARYWGSSKATTSGRVNA